MSALVERDRWLLRRLVSELDGRHSYRIQRLALEVARVLRDKAGVGHAIVMSVPELREASRTLLLKLQLEKIMTEAVRDLVPDLPTGDNRP